MNSIAFQPDVDEKYIVSASDDFTCKIWSTESGDLLKTIPLDSPGTDTSLSFIVLCLFVFY